MQKLVDYFVPRLAWLYLNFVGKTSKIYWSNLDELEKYEKQFHKPLYAFWHGRQLFFAYAYRNQPAASLVSQSHDGEYIAQAIRLFGMETVRGSSSRGGRRALVKLKRILESGKAAAVTPDGPKGPQKTVASGILFLSKKTGKQILPITYSAKRKLIFHGWDDYWVPLPFNTILIRYGKPIAVLPEDNIEKKSQELANELNRITQEADELCLKDDFPSLKKSALLTDVSPFQLPSVTEKILYLIYNIGLLIFSPFILFAICLRYPQTFFKHFHKGLSMRMGLLNKPETPPTHSKKTIWVHASSLGECRAAIPLIHALRKKYPNHFIALSSSTVTGIAEAEKLHLADLIFYSPIDVPFILKNIFRKIQPQIILLMESEIWPNWIRIAKNSNVKVGIVNGRISQRSAQRYLKIKRISRILMNKIDFVCAREKADAERFEAIGIPKNRIQLTGNLKFDLQPWNIDRNLEPVVPKTVFSEKKSLWVAGSVRDGEEKFIFDAFLSLLKKHPNLKLVFAPRHLDHIHSIIHTLKSLKLHYLLRSQITESPKPQEVLDSARTLIEGVSFEQSEASSRSKVFRNQGTEFFSFTNEKNWNVLIWDTFGDLWRAYQESTVVFVGGSLVPTGGQNPVEPAWFSKPILFGPHMENFAEPAKILLESNGAIQVQNSAELASAIDALLSNPEKISDTGAKAKNAIEKFSGRATEETMKVINSFLSV